ncbi:MAG TPA: MXAN_5187 C-terminal domain-containing protein [Archangium sp.]|uniref:MXAN_5187 C-terminal domain-containing protein n=1 Tax=Archangium sp. TaxID=1872627 RepID=UPI002E31D840|nr:MXAN_5187 C-terminal domain-containing protein [Archangium sp.]HEX5752550.1 MXAN_5187 C-terminal domain-containing protein [Archangium sp.]
MAYESSKSSTKNQALKAGTSAKSSAKLAATSGDTKSGMPTMSGSEVAFQECDAIEADIAALKVAYEFYFMGNERLPPTRAYEDLKKRLERLKTSFIRNTAAKFRVQAIATKFATYERLWQRTLQEIENGTYKRDVAKVKRRTQKQAGSDRPKTLGAIELPDEDFDVEEVKPSKVPSIAPLVPPVEPVPFRGGVPSVAPLVPSVAPLVPPVAPVAGTPARGTAIPSIPSVAPVAPRVAPVVPPVAPAVPRVAPAVPPVAARPAAKPAGARPPVAASGGGLSDDKLKSVYDAYVAAKRQNKEDTSKMNYDSIAATLRKQVPELMKQHNARSVEFKVVIKDGKAVLKAVPK